MLGAVGDWFRTVLILFFNVGLQLGLVMGLLILLRPLTCRLLTPGQRVFLWGVGWVMGWPQALTLLARIPMPVSTLPDLVIPRAERGYPLFVPLLPDGGTYRLALPGGGLIPFSVSEEAVELLGWLGLLYVVVSCILALRGDIGVRRMARQGVELTREEAQRLGMAEEGKVVIRMCPRLPTSFVFRRMGRHEIVLQKELPDQQLRLVLLHEWEHVRRRDPWLQGIAVVVLNLCFWNPILWLAYHLTRRDMELACDQRVLSQLNEEERRIYAHTLVDLACDKPVWGGVTTFGECDASLRVKAAIRWKPEDGGTGRTAGRVLGWTAAVALFLVAGGPYDRTPAADLTADLEDIGAWTLLARELRERDITVDRTDPLWIQADDGFAFLYFQDTEGNLWEAMVRRQLYHGGVELYVTPIARLPDLANCETISWR